MGGFCNSRRQNGGSGKQLALSISSPFDCPPFLHLFSYNCSLVVLWPRNLRTQSTCSAIVGCRIAATAQIQYWAPIRCLGTEGGDVGEPEGGSRSGTIHNSNPRVLPLLNWVCIWALAWAGLRSLWGPHKSTFHTTKGYAEVCSGTCLSPHPKWAIWLPPRPSIICSIMFCISHSSQFLFCFLIYF